jgi:predicted hydrocarbon binding protein
VNDLRIALRTLRATPIVTLVVILSLALGIGANATMFSIGHDLASQAVAWVRALRQGARPDMIDSSVHVIVIMKWAAER